MLGLSHSGTLWLQEAVLWRKLLAGGGEWAGGLAALPPLVAVSVPCWRGAERGRACWGIQSCAVVMACVKPQRGGEAGEGIGAVGQDHIGKDSLHQTRVGHSWLLILRQFCHAGCCYCGVTVCR